MWNGPNVTKENGAGHSGAHIFCLNCYKPDTARFLFIFFLREARTSRVLKYYSSQTKRFQWPLVCNPNPFYKWGRVEIASPFTKETMDLNGPSATSSHAPEAPIHTPWSFFAVFERYAVSSRSKYQFLACRFWTRGRGFKVVSELRGSWPILGWRKGQWGFGHQE